MMNGVGLALFLGERGHALLKALSLRAVTSELVEHMLERVEGLTLRLPEQLEGVPGDSDVVSVAGRSDGLCQPRLCEVASRADEVEPDVDVEFAVGVVHEW